MPRPPHLKVRLPKPKIPRPHRRFRLPRLAFRRYQAGALWALVALAALATLPSLVPGQSSGSALGDGLGVSAQEEAAAGPGAAAPTPTVTTPTASDNEIPEMALRAYRYAEAWASGFDPSCKLSWSVLAGIGRIESNHGRHFGAQTRFSSTGDVTPTILGPVLNGAPNTGTIHDTDGGRLDGDPLWDQANLRRAIYAYNHSVDYVNAVIAWANFYLQHEGQGSLLEVQVPAGPSSSIQPGVAAGGTGVAT